MNRRTALQALGATLASAGLPGCGSSLIPLPAVREDVGPLLDAVFEVKAWYMDGGTGECKATLRYFSDSSSVFWDEVISIADVPCHGCANRGWNAFLRVPGSDWYKIGWYDPTTELQQIANKLAARVPLPYVKES
jgi:hypothetical protein